MTTNILSTAIALLTLCAVIFILYHVWVWIDEKNKFLKNIYNKNKERELRMNLLHAFNNVNKQLVDLQVFVHALGFDPDKVVKFMSDCNDPMLRDFCLNHLTIIINDEQLQKELPNGYMKQISEWFSEQTKSKVHVSTRE